MRSGIWPRPTWSSTRWIEVEHQTHFVTGTAAPCTGIFKPVWLDADLPDTGPAPSGTYDTPLHGAAALFWRHEALHRATLRDYAARMAQYKSERDALEKRLVEGALACRDGPPSERANCSAHWFAEADEAEARWLERVTAQQLTSRLGLLHTTAWRGFNRAAQMPVNS